MRTMTIEEIRKDWSGLRKRHRREIAEAVARYCIGHTNKEIAQELGYSIQWVRDQLVQAGVYATFGDEHGTPLTAPTDRDVSKEVQKVVSTFGPTVEEESSEDFEPYFNHYHEQGHSDENARALARAEWAAEAAVAAGVIKETKNKKDERVNQILFPKDAKDTFDLDLKMHMARVKAAADFLDKSKVRNLRRKSTCEKVAEADAKWREQAELVLQHYQPSKET